MTSETERIYEVDDFCIKHSYRGMEATRKTEIEVLVPSYSDKDWHLRLERATKYPLNSFSSEDKETEVKAHLISKKIGSQAMSLAASIDSSIFDYFKNSLAMMEDQYAIGKGMILHNKEDYSYIDDIEILVFGGDRSSLVGSHYAGGRSGGFARTALIKTSRDKVPTQLVKGNFVEVDVTDVYFARMIEKTADCEPAIEKTTEQIVAGLMRRVVSRLKKSRDTVAVCLTGRSGSGKSTAAQALKEKLMQKDISSAIISVDDYNRGRSGLRELFGHDNHTNWDAHHVYDTALLAGHVERLKGGLSVPRFVFDFELGERRLAADEVIEPAQVIIVEGIMANSLNLEAVTDLSYVIPTSLAACIGRRVLRDIQQNRAGAIGATAEDILRYQLEIAEPEYQSRLTAPL